MTKPEPSQSPPTTLPVDSMMDSAPDPTLPREALLRILEFSQRLASSHPFERLQQEVVNAGCDVLLAEAGALWLFDPAGGQLTLKVPVRRPDLGVSLQLGSAGECLREKRISRLNEQQLRSHPETVLQRVCGVHIRSLLSVPLLGRRGEPIGVLQVVNKHGGSFDQADQVVAVALAAQCAVAIQRMQLTEALLVKERLDEEVSLAREIQMSTLPEAMPQYPGYAAYGEFRPLVQTGGDTFDLVDLNGRLFVLMGDASGHGFGPALSATQMQAMLRVAFRCGASLGDAYAHVNNQLYEDLPPDHFLTAFMGLLDGSTGRLHYYSGGQGPILLYRAASDSCEWHPPSDMPLGIMEMTEAGTGRFFDLQAGDVLALLSDGVYEYRSDQGREFGRERVGEWLHAHHRLGVAEMAQLLFSELEIFGCDAPAEDDMTVVLIKRLDEADECGSKG